jgi:thiamine-monophosphate kinase
MISEFELINRYFGHLPSTRSDVVVGIGDDAAVLRVPAGRELVVAMDTLVASRHFPVESDAFDVGYKSLAVNLSDLAAMGAVPAWATLSLTLPEVDEDWLQGFSQGFAQLAAAHRVQLVGGDTTRGPLSITVQLHGFVKPGKALRRDSAKAGQEILVTGVLGDAAAALRQLVSGQEADAALLERLQRPRPRVSFGQFLVESGASAIDISDGLLADLGHILRASHCGATLQVDDLPASPALRRLPTDEMLTCQLSGGDDYELCITVDPDRVDWLRKVALQQELLLTRIGRVERQPGLRCLRADGQYLQPEATGYDHFAHEN